MNSYNFSEKDWKLYRNKIAGWQEAYMERLCEEYMEILRADEIGSERFWKLHDRIKKDKKSPGVLITRSSRSDMIDNIFALLIYRVITMDDLDDFSEELKEQLVFIIKNHPEFFDDKKESEE